jgi:hypothetical protein
LEAILMEAVYMRLALLAVSVGILCGTGGCGTRGDDRTTSSHAGHHYEGDGHDHAHHGHRH